MMIHNQCNLSRRTIVQTNKFKGDMVSIFKSIHHWEKLEWLAETNEMTTERGPGRLCLHLFFQYVEFGWKSTQKNRTGVCCCASTDGAKAVRVPASGRWWKEWKANGKKWPPRCLPHWSQREKKKRNIPCATKSNWVLLRHINKGTRVTEPKQLSSLKPTDLVANLLLVLTGHF